MPAVADLSLKTLQSGEELQRIAREFNYDEWALSDLNRSADGHFASPVRILEGTVYERCRFVNESPNKEIRWTGALEVMRVSGPIILGSLSFTVMQFVDQIMVSRLGTNALAACGSAGIWSYVMGCFLFGVVGCVSTFAAQCYGRGELNLCARYAWQGIYLSVLAGVLAIALYPLAPLLFSSMGHSAEVTQLELVFFRVRLLGYFAMAWTTALASFFQVVGHPAIPMYIGIAANIVNLALNYVLIFGHFGCPALGVAGSALATVLATCLQGVVMQWIFMNGTFHSRFNSRREYRIDWHRIHELFRIGLASGITLFMDVCNWAIFTSFIVGHFGAVSLAAHNAALSFMHLCFMPALGLNQGTAALVGQYIGRRDCDTAAARTYTAMKIAIVYMGVMGVLFGVYGRELIHQFFSQEPEVIALGHKLLIMAAVFQVFDATNIIIMGALRGAGDTWWMAFAITCAAYGFFLPLSLLLAFPAGMDAIGAWIGATAYIVGISGVLIARFRRGRWRKIDIFLKTPVQPTVCDAEA